MAAKRKNPEYRQETKKPEQETVLTISKASVEDTELNPPKKEEPVEDSSVEKLPDWMGEAIRDKDAELILEGQEEQKLTDIPLTPPATEVNPIKESFEELNAAQAEKKALFEQRKAQNDLLAYERERFLTRRRSRAILVPEVPSKRKTYPVDATIAYLPYNVQDLEDMNNPEIPLFERYLVALDGMQTSGMTPLDLTFNDFLFICDARQLQALGTDVSFRYPYVCTSCNRTGVISFKLNQVEFNELECNLPIKVRFHSFPDEEFRFIPHTIGDTITLMKNDVYWRRLGQEYLVTDDGDRIVDDMAINASRCISHPWETAYYMFLEASENPQDRAIFDQIDKLLDHGMKPLKFRCIIPTENKQMQNELAIQAAALVNGVASGELSTTTPNDETPENEMPPWVQVHFEGSGNKNMPVEKIKRCGATNQIDVLVGDIIIPFRKHRVDLEYGILGQ